MLKSGGKRKFSAVSAEELEKQAAENELEAELKALEAIRAEKSGASDSQRMSSSHLPYNKDTLLKVADGLLVNSMPFVESMQICEFEVNITNDNDDLEREVRFLAPTEMCDDVRI